MLGLYKSEREPTDMRLFLFEDQFSGPDAGSGNTPGPSLRVYTSGPVYFCGAQSIAVSVGKPLQPGRRPYITEKLRPRKTYGVRGIEGAMKLNTSAERQEPTASWRIGERPGPHPHPRR